MRRIAGDKSGFGPLSSPFSRVLLRDIACPTVLTCDIVFVVELLPPFRRRNPSGLYPVLHRDRASIHALQRQSTKRIHNL